jgi:hypothetical protein
MHAAKRAAEVGGTRNNDAGLTRHNLDDGGWLVIEGVPNRDPPALQFGRSPRRPFWEDTRHLKVGYDVFQSRTSEVTCWCPFSVHPAYGRGSEQAEADHQKQRARKKQPQRGQAVEQEDPPAAPYLWSRSRPAAQPRAAFTSLTPATADARRSSAAAA